MVWLVDAYNISHSSSSSPFKLLKSYSRDFIPIVGTFTSSSTAKVAAKEKDKVESDRGSCGGLNCLEVNESSRAHWSQPVAAEEKGDPATKHKRTASDLTCEPLMCFFCLYAILVGHLEPMENVFCVLLLNRKLFRCPLSRLLSFYI
ncbi:unnamed protein product [Hydatigera taeniaeformis]|uniref:Ovule protein n=1 Tax=Hydatigena taeniaeformis TaxID=6205 RepID=A0A0R3WYT8_HYDTA|nr:unnamed protein product [Hydatigera taeniaeformis]